MARVAVVQMVSSAVVEENLATLDELVVQSLERGAELLVLPEMFACMGSREQTTASIQAGYDDSIYRKIRQLAREYRLWIVAGAIPHCEERGQALPYSRSVLVDDCGDVVAAYDKLHLFDADVSDTLGGYRESETFSPGNYIVCADTPFGKIGLTICYDLRFPELYRLLAAQGAEIITVPSAFTRVTGEAHWQVLLQARAIENGCYVLAANQGGQHSKIRETYGHSCVLDPWGGVLASMQTGAGIIVADIDSKEVQQTRSKMPCAQHLRIRYDDTALKKV